ncbi:MAG: gamma-glutamyl-gamma-aminobutyrate hydrolase family protein [Trueperaceae bacterium]|nr:gamma-glutamyl-gamma-aminobutyrate hydrolase family protein [Trueperaceae bacterium]
MTRPTILLTMGSSFRNGDLRRLDVLTGHNYNEAIVKAGGLPLMVSNHAPDLAETYAQQVDGVVFSGGPDIDPSYFDADPHPDLGLVDRARDAFEIALYKAAKARGVPVLGVCRGIQLINVAEGGSLYQHVPAVEGAIQHDQRDPEGGLTHRVTLEEGSRFARALGRRDYRTNSYHHQAVERLGRDLEIVGRSGDGMVEIVEGTSDSFVLGVQWHPEMSFARYPEQLLPFTVFLDAVQAAQLAKAA